MRVTQREIAKKLGISHATVSFVLSGRMDVQLPETTRRKVMDAAREMGYRPNRLAQALVRGRTETVIGWIPLPFADFTEGLIEALSSAARRRGLELILRAFSGQDQLGIHPLLDDWPSDGLILVLGDHHPTANELEHLELPAVKFSAAATGAIPQVSIDFRTPLAQCMQAFRAEGCQTVVILNSMMNASASGLSVAEVRAAATDAGLEPTVSSVPDETARGASRAIGLAGPKDAIFAMSDRLGFAVLKALDSMGFTCPIDVKLACVGGCEMNELVSPSLSVIHIPVDRLAEELWRQLDGVRQGLPASSLIDSNIEASFIDRDSISNR